MASERRESLEGIRVAFAALQDAVEAVDAARLELFDISATDERELRDLVQRVQSLVGELLLKVDDWQPPSVPAPQQRAARAASPRWLN
ncbi:MAG: hypothetical protein RL033_2829 [Pseudomonadota bacterium]